MISSRRTAVILVLVTAHAAPLLAANDKTTINLSNKSGAVGETITLEASLLSTPPNSSANFLAAAVGAGDLLDAHTGVRENCGRGLAGGRS